MKKIISLGIVIVIMIGLGVFSGCTGCDEFTFHVPTFEEKCVTTEDGFVYYPVEEEGVYIIDIPDTEEVTIPEFIDGQKVVQLGYKDMGLGYMKEYWVDGRHVKQLIIQHNMNYYLSNFMNVETLICVNPTVSLNLVDNKKLIIDNRLSSSNSFADIILQGLKTIILRSNDDVIVTNNEIKDIYIGDLVMEIDAGVFDGLEGVTIKTSYESKPDGWAKGWNGTCKVEWGANIDN